MIDPNVPYSPVHASRGKFGRAEPVAALYEQNRVHHIGAFPLLEDQLVSFVPDLDRASAGSPDRVDSLVWAMTELCVERTPYHGLFTWYEQETARLRVAGGAPSETGRSGDFPTPMGVGETRGTEVVHAALALSGLFRGALCRL